jgi:large subunit ribosomal protein L19
MESGVKISPVNMAERVSLGIKSGDVVRVWQKIEELKKTKQANKKEVMTKNVRKQAFEGTVLSVKHGTEPGATFTVRKVASGVGVERIFPLYSPGIDSIELLRRTRTRRAKLYFIREKAAREARRLLRKQLTVEPRASVAEEAPAEASQEAEAAVE